MNSADLYSAWYIKHSNLTRKYKDVGEVSGCTYYIINNSKKKTPEIQHSTQSNNVRPNPLPLAEQKSSLILAGCFPGKYRILQSPFEEHGKISVIYFHVYKANTCYNPVEQQAVISESVIFSVMFLLYYVAVQSPGNHSPSPKNSVSLKHMFRGFAESGASGFDLANAFFQACF